MLVACQLHRLLPIPCPIDLGVDRRTMYRTYHTREACAWRGGTPIAARLRSQPMTLANEARMCI